ncbi:MAG: hypothetical protein WCO60_03630 [Verrucomicrobiota bacterium]
MSRQLQARLSVQWLAFVNARWFSLYSGPCLKIGGFLNERFMDIGGFVFPYGASIVALVAQERLQICVVSSLGTNGHGWACVLVHDLWIFDDFDFG